MILIPVSLILGGVGLAAFFWTLTSDQYDDPEGDARRILSGQYDDAPKPERRDRQGDDNREDSASS